ncbi:PREDICTED: glutathione S-transferase T3-like [Brassica oleracea var. oleracea]|uniref:glutathione S-transferase T3-like n=1 Tax=Brassica oleracea var. oleracea TaxID=109376 RepID=UPI0006A6F493|nr:PREDICTED: glutathione S-transferase T3-like [Brassica oleracea var. oleracea]
MELMEKLEVCVERATTEAKFQPSKIWNEQKTDSFWKRIGAYFNESPQLVGMPQREGGNCKQRWFKISDQVSKFVASLRAATGQQSSGQNDNDVMKLAYEIYHNDYAAKKGEDGSQASVQSSNHGDREEARPKGVKKAKARLKAKEMEATSTKPMEKLQDMFEIRKQDHELRKQDLELKKQDFEMKEKLNKQHMLETLLAKKEPLSESEIALKNKLISDILS